MKVVRVELNPPPTGGDGQTIAVRGNLVSDKRLYVIVEGVKDKVRYKIPYSSIRLIQEVSNG